MLITKTIIKDLEIMGGNGSYSKEFGGVPVANRTHIETEYRIDGHKVLLFGENVEHDKIIMNANSDSPTYLFASVDKMTGNVVISGIGIYQKEKLTVSVDLKFDNHGNLITFSQSENGSHSHLWEEISPGVIGRKSHDKSNYFPIDSKLDSLIAKIVDFNKKGKKWKQDKN